MSCLDWRIEIAGLVDCSKGSGFLGYIGGAFMEISSDDCSMTVKYIQIMVITIKREKHNDRHRMSVSSLWFKVANEVLFNSETHISE